jgi:hypothetical protein
MAKMSPFQTSRAQRREEAKRRTQRRRLLAWLGGFVFVAVITALIAWWILGQAGPSNAQALYQFDTPDLHSLAFDPANADTVFFGHHGGLLVSQDAGKSWQEGTVQDADAMQLGLPPNADRRYITGHDVFLVSTDGGETWQLQPNNLPGLDLHGFAVAPSAPNRLYAFEMQSGGLFTSADGGAIWESRTLPPGMAMGMLPLAIAPDDPLHVYAGVGSQITESLDGGQTWQTQPGPGGMAASLAIAPTTPAAIYAGTDQGLWRRGADGAWQQLPVEPNGAILALTASPSQPERIGLVDQEGNFYRSDDGGQTWAGE